MGEKDIKLKVYFDDAKRYADLWNGTMFQGKQIVKAEVCTLDSGKSGTDRLRHAGTDYAAGDHGICGTNQTK